MGRTAGLQLVSKITYYVGWISLICGGLLHMNIGRALFTAINMTKRNLFELGLVCFIICVASEVRTIRSAEKELPAVVERKAAA